MSQLTSAELVLLRERPQSSEIYLSIYRPPISFQAQIDDASIEKGDTVILFDNISIGSWSGIVPNVTMLVGSEAGKSDLGKIRVRGATGTYVWVADNDYVHWADDAYITVLNFHELFPKYASIEEDYVDEDDDILIYTDGDISYSNQGNVLGSLICMGGHYAGFIDTQVFYSATGTYNPKGDTLTYNWTFEGGNPATATGITPGYVAYISGGHYTTTLRVTNSSGGQDLSYRHISMYDRFSCPPVDNWGMDSLNGSRGEGGYTVSIWIRHPNMDYIVDGALIVLFSEDIYGDTQVSIGGNSYNRNSILFAGYIISNSIQYDAETSKVSFQAQSITGVMKITDGMGTSTDNVATATKWQHVSNMNLPKALYHFYKHYSTLTEVADMRYVGSTLQIKAFETDQTNMYDAVSAYIASHIQGAIIADRQGTVWFEEGIGITDNATGTYPVGMSLRKQDWMDTPEINRVFNNTVSILDMGGFAYSGPVTGTETPYMAEAPGNLKAYYGSPQAGEAGLLLLDQNDLNTKTGNMYAYLNATYPDIHLSLIGAFRNLDITPYEQVLFTVHEEDTNQGIIFTEKPFHVTDMTLVYSPDKRVLLSNINMHEITQGVPADFLEVPQMPDENYAFTPYIPNYDFLFPSIPSPLAPTEPLEVTASEFPDCLGEINPAPNGPWYYPGLKNTYENTELTTAKVGCGAFLRDSDFAIDKRSYIIIRGKFEERLISGSSLGAWTTYTGNSWYHVWGLDEYGHRIVSGTNSAMSADGSRRIYFNNCPTGTALKWLEFEIDKNSLEDVGSVIFDVGISSPYSATSLSWGFVDDQKSKIWIDFTGNAYNSTGGSVTIEGGTLVKDTADTFYKWNKMFYRIELSEISIEVTNLGACPGFIQTAGVGWSTYDGYVTPTSSALVRSGNIWTMPDTCFTGQVDSTAGVYKVMGGGLEAYFTANTSPLNSPCYFKTYSINVHYKAQISLEASKRVTITSFELYNVCAKAALYLNDEYGDVQNWALPHSPSGLIPT